MSDDIEMTLSLKCDDDGFISQECPECKKRFKVKYGEGSDKPISYCPYCAHEGSDCWWTEAQTDYISKVVLQGTIEPEIEKMANNLKHHSHKGDLVSISMDYKPTSKAVAPQEKEDDWPKMLFECCSETIKHEKGHETLFCVICQKKKQTK